ncbi:thioesterase [Halobacillus rhizosphaerae]|uniref:thioesterase family protein n=1 Tax=Halobacillus rhizosphaerae TaxID=3064889 RepID=UPI00398B90BC
MNPGLEVGKSATVTNKVTKEMFPSFDGEVIHPVLSTVSLVHHMEWAARRLILPYITPEEEGMGASVEVTHSSPAIEGDEIVAKATVVKIKQRMILCNAEVRSGHIIIGKGSVTQAIIPKTYIKKQIEELQKVK